MTIPRSVPSIDYFICILWVVSSRRRCHKLLWVLHLDVETGGCSTTLAWTLNVLSSCCKCSKTTFSSYPGGVVRVGRRRHRRGLRLVLQPKRERGRLWLVRLSDVGICNVLRIQRRYCVDIIYYLRTSEQCWEGDGCGAGATELRGDGSPALQGGHIIYISTHIYTYLHNLLSTLFMSPACSY